jgi:hypothetical protein
LKKILSLAFLASVLSCGILPAQVVETPQPFDSAGRVLSLTPFAAARTGLGPPEWRISGDYVEARLYRNASGNYVIAVTRRDQSVERYDVTADDVIAIRAKVSGSPSQFAFRSQGRASSAFVRNQTLMGIGVYGPAMAYAIANEATGRGATYLLTAGATFFAATHLARRIQISPEMNSLGTHMGLRGGLIGLGTAHALDMSPDALAGGALIGSLGGTAAGLLLGSSWDPQEVVASEIGADLTAVTAWGLFFVVRGDGVLSEAARNREIVLLSGATVAGYVLGHRYGNIVSHNITVGDARTLWVTGALGVSAGSIAIAGRDPSDRATGLALTSGWVAGVLAGELLLARRFDLSENDASLLALGSGAGALIGLGVARLTDNEGETDSRTMTWTTLGGIGGLFLTHYLLAPPVDAGKLPAGTSARSSLQFNPVGLAMTAAKVPGSFPLLSVTFR